MNENQRELRRTAAREFMQSLAQLEDMLQPDTSKSENRVEASQTDSQIESSIPPEETGFDSLAANQALDQVAADLDRYMEAIKLEEL
ncbi:MAG: hypothetical protein MJA27_30795 [Pseudanabaenales cyanobacterium]|nr:hypothetical protein [Pseudanabaenales cyanobacterium]